MVVAGNADNRHDAALLLDVLGLAGAAWRWDAARVACVAVAGGQRSAAFTANDLSRRVPRRARPLIAPALRWLQDAGLAEQLPGRRVMSSSPGARHRRIPVYQLTPAGDDLSRQVRPPAGSDITFNSLC